MEEQIFTDSFLEVPASKEKLRNLLKTIPRKPGVYKFLNKSKQPIYIGKAKNLQKRISSYFRDSTGTSNKIKKLINSLQSFEITITNTELEALLMEQYLIKDRKPKFNVQFKDDKGYPWIRIDSSKEFPSAKSFLGRKDDKAKFFGPFPSSNAVQDSLKLIQKTFNIRNCSDSFFKNRTRPCIQYEIGRCSAPCVGLIQKKEYIQEVSSAELLLSGKSEQLISSFYDLMDLHSKDKSFEKAAIYRDKISSLRDVQRLQSITGHTKERDAISICTIEGQTKVGITHVNEGWVTGHENFIQKKTNLEGSTIEYFIKAHYFNKVYCPANLVIGESLTNKKTLELALSEFHGKAIKIITKLGKKDKGLLQICENNTKFSFNRGVKSKNILLAFKSLAKELSLSNGIRIIESYDISHHSGSAAVAGCVIYSQKGKEKQQYKQFNISKENAGNDIASMIEVLERRFRNKSIGMEVPSLILLDGGKVHLLKVANKLKELNLEEIPIMAISKGVRRKLEMDSIHKQDGSIKKISKGSVADNLIQEIRDETHRFAISLQKKKLKKISTSSSLDQLVGVGPKRKKMLIRYFGSVEQIKRASAQDLSNVPGLGDKTASLIYNQLQ